MRMVRCYECGRSYDYDDDGFCPRCGAFNQPARAAAAAVSSAPASGTRDDGTGRGKQQIQRDMEANLKRAEKAIADLLGGQARWPRLPGGHR